MKMSDLDSVPTSSKATAMHSHDRTLLANLGFSDPDKKNPEHDRICQYLVTDESIGKLKAWISNLIPPKKVGSYKSESSAWDVTRSDDIVCSYVPEYHLTKGDGQYKTSIGFIDISLEFTRKYAIRQTSKVVWGESRYMSKRNFVSSKIPNAVFKDSGDGWGNAVTPDEWVPVKDGEDVRQDIGYRIFVEVKVAKIGIGDIIRQMKLYETYFPVSNKFDFLPNALLIAPWDLDDNENKVVRDSGFAFMKVGDGYKKWRDETSVSTSKPILEL